MWVSRAVLLLMLVISGCSDSSSPIARSGDDGGTTADAMTKEKTSDASMDLATRNSSAADAAFDAITRDAVTTDSASNTPSGDGVEERFRSGLQYNGSISFLRRVP
jgi:PBP1b-binding outer membrane lipoprotein LpoB